MKIIDGGITAAKGFKAAAAAAEIKYKGRTDMAMVYSEVINMHSIKANSLCINHLS